MESSSDQDSREVETRSQHEELEEVDGTMEQPRPATLRRHAGLAAAACFLVVAAFCTKQKAPALLTPPVFRGKAVLMDRNPTSAPNLSTRVQERTLLYHLRSLEDNGDDQQANQADNNGDDQQANQADDNQGDENDRQPGQDDFFDDFIQDDLVVDNGSAKAYDDFYVFENDHTPKLFPLHTPTIVGFLVAALALGLGASSGTGGGGTIVPIYILISGLPIQVAIPIGAVTVLGGALASTCFNWTRRHPLADRVLIDWDLVLVMEPLTLVGALLGTLFHRLLSAKVLIVLLVLLLSITAHTTLSKAMRMYQAEIRYIRHLRAAQSEPPIGSSPSSISKADTWGAASDVEHLAIKPEPRDSRQIDAEKQAILIMNPDFVTLRSELMQQEKFTPRSKIIALCCIFSVLIFLNIMVGGGAYQSPWDIDCGSVAFWVVHAIMIAFLIASAWAAHSYVVARFEVKQLVRFDYVHGDIKWDTRSAILYPAVFVIAGVFAGTLGIGGGSECPMYCISFVCVEMSLTAKFLCAVITVPIMLAMGVHPGVVSATSSAMILFTSIASSTSFFVFGLILVDFAVVGFLVGFFAASLGQILMKQARQARSASGRDFERNSFTAFAIGGVILISALLMSIEVSFSRWPTDDPSIRAERCLQWISSHLTLISFAVCIHNSRAARRAWWALRRSSILARHVMSTGRFTIEIHTIEIQAIIISNHCSSVSILRGRRKTLPNAYLAVG